MISSAAYRLRAMPTPFAPARILAQDLDRFWGGRSAQILIEGWRREYNQIRPHRALGYPPPPAPERSNPGNVP